MSESLGKMDKPEVSQFKNGRKLFLVPLIVLPPSTDPSHKALIDKYWREVSEHVANLESKLSQTKYVFHELVPSEDSINQLEKMMVGTYQLVKSQIEKGATLCSIEDDEIMQEFLDWNMCLSLRLHSHKVFTKIYDAFQEVVLRRNESIAKRIDDALESEAVGVLFLREGHRVQFPSDIQVFYIAPPSLDVLRRTINDWKQAKPTNDDPTCDCSDDDCECNEKGHEASGCECHCDDSKT